MFNSGYYYDPSLSAQQRMLQMQQQYPQYMPQQPQQMQQPQPQVQQQVVQQRYGIIPVTSEDEAKASPVDTVNDTPSFFFNRGKNEIYLKQFNRQTGGANFETFTLVQSNLNGGNGQNNINPYQENFDVINGKLDRLCLMFDKDVELTTNYSQLENETVTDCNQLEDKPVTKRHTLKKGAKNAE